MVVRLEGKVQGNDVIFNRIYGDDWEAVIPPSLNGAYIVELKAYDDAGNMAYTARYILIIDLTSIHAKIKIRKIETKIRLSRYHSKERLSQYYAKVRCCNDSI